MEPKINVEFHITLENGSLNLAGPLNDKILCLGLLESAKEAVLSMHRENDRRINEHKNGVISPTH